MVEAPGIRHQQAVDANPTRIHVGVRRRLRRDESPTRGYLHGDPPQHRRIRGGLSRRQGRGLHPPHGPVEGGEDRPVVGRRGRQGADDVPIELDPRVLARPDEEGSVGGQFHLDPDLEQWSVDHRHVAVAITINVHYHTGVAQPQNQFLEGIGRLRRLGDLEQLIVQWLELPPNFVPLDVSLAFLQIRLDVLLRPGWKGGVQSRGMIQCVQRSDEAAVRIQVAPGGPVIQILPDGWTSCSWWFLRLDSGKAQPA